MTDLPTMLREAVALVERATPEASRDRPAAYPGGCMCEQCGSTFVGAEDHTLCGRCHAHMIAEVTCMSLFRQHGPALVADAEWRAFVDDFVGESALRELRRRFDAMTPPAGRG